VELAGSGAVADLVERLAEGCSPLQARTYLEKEYEPETCLALLDCASCRIRYGDKFEQPHRWLLTREAAEQASHQAVARWRAQWLKDTFGPESITELGCGIGGDSVYLARTAEMTSFEQCPARTLLALHNLESVTPGSKATVLNREVNCKELNGELLYCDPARRGETRLSRPEDWLPPLPHIVECFNRSRFTTVLVKCSPGLNRTAVPGTYFYLSLEGQMKEAFLVLHSQLEQCATAVLLSTNPQAPTLLYQTTNSEIPPAEPAPGRFLHNPDPAILRAGALDALATELSAGIVHPKIAYLVSREPCTHRGADSFRILHEEPLNWKRLRKTVGKMDWWEFEYLGRGVPFSQSEVRQKLKFKGRATADARKRGTVIIYREERGYRAVLGERVEKRKTVSGP